MNELGGSSVVAGLDQGSGKHTTSVPRGRGSIFSIASDSSNLVWRVISSRSRGKSNFLRSLEGDVGILGLCPCSLVAPALPVLLGRRAAYPCLPSLEMAMVGAARTEEETLYFAPVDATLV